MQSRPTKKSTAKSNFDVATKTVFPAAASEAMPPVRTAVCRRATVTRAPRSRARLLPVTTRRNSWRSHVHRTYTAQRVQPFKLQTRNVGGRGGRPSPFSGGSKGGILFGKRIPPLSGSSAKSCTNHAVPTALQPTHPSKRGAESLRPSGRKKRAVHRTTLIFCSISQCG